MEEEEMVGETERQKISKLVSLRIPRDSQIQIKSE
jgi:hypothetical protein